MKIYLQDTQLSLAHTFELDTTYSLSKSSSKICGLVFDQQSLYNGALCSCVGIGMGLTAAGMGKLTLSLPAQSSPLLCFMATLFLGGLTGRAINNACYHFGKSIRRIS